MSLENAEAKQTPFVASESKLKMRYDNVVMALPNGVFL
jgi:hypothetical protein